MPKKSWPIYMVTYNIKWVKTFGVYGMISNNVNTLMRMLSWKIVFTKELTPSYQKYPREINAHQDRFFFGTNINQINHIFKDQLEVLKIWEYTKIEFK